MVASYDRLTTELKRSCLRLKDELLFTPQRIKNANSKSSEVDLESELLADGAAEIAAYRDQQRHSLASELESLMPRLSDVELRSPEYYYHIEVPSESKFFRIGFSEYVFISMLDGETSFAHALAVTAQKLGPNALSENQATQTIQWLLQNGLADFADGTVSVDSDKSEQNQASLLQKLNPFWLKIPLGKPDEVLESAQPYFRWLFHPVSVVIAILIMIAALMTVGSNWDAFMASSQQIFSPSNWIWMLVTWVVLKIVHEFAHGLVCNKYGGKVKETGIIFILLAPMAYVDVTSSWGFSSRWRRMAVALAGMYVELLIAALCVFAWCYTTSPMIEFQLFNIIFMASFTTILFNANPLMRFDGYYALSDLLGIPNLYTSGNQSFKNQMRWLFFGQFQESSFRELNESSRIVATYGICAAIWKVMICVSLGITASVMFGGMGILLAVFGVFSWFGKPMKKLVEDIISLNRSRPQSVYRAAMVAGSIALVLVSSWFWIPNPFAARSPCVVDFEEQSKVRADSAGFVEKVLVENGQPVNEGEPLIVLTNNSLAAEIAELRSELEQHKTRERIAIDDHDSGQAQIERGHRLAKQSILDERLKQAEELVVMAPVNGRVVARDLHLMQGTYIKKGDIVLLIGDEDNKEVVLSIGEDDANTIGDLVGKPVPIQIGSRRRIMGKIKRIEPKASVDVRNECLISPNGGSLVVQQNSSSDPKDSEAPYELCAPRFHAIVSIDELTSRELRCGQRGTALLGSNAPTVGKWLYRSLKTWIADQLQFARETAGLS